VAEKKINSRGSARGDTREALLSAGLTHIWEQGYNNTGLQEILTTAGLPKGSFYHFFKSKEDFGLQIIDYYWDLHTGPEIALLCDEQQAPRERLQAFLDLALETARESLCSRGCLVANLAQELADIHPGFRKRLANLMQEYENALEVCLKSGQAAGQFRDDIEARSLATVMINSQYGALVRMKAEKDPRAVRIHRDSMLEFVRPASARSRN
jgi:TetR/AcrR family transcriptional repressor of nem operon